MPFAQKKSVRKFSYADYVSWPDDERWELIDGVAYDMSPAPSVTHQKITGKFYILLSTHPEKKAECFVGIAPTDVVLSKHDVVQPDVFVVCDEKKITEANIQGAPDVVIEVLSPATALKDRREKKTLYERYGVKEYVLVDPVGQYVERLLLADDGSYGRAEIYGPKDVFPLSVLEGIKISLWQVFEIEAPERNTDSRE